MSSLFNIESAPYQKAYGILCARLPSLFDRDGLYPTLCRVESRGQTLRHRHFEAETFYIISGTGQLEIDGHSRMVRAGDLVQIAPFEDHQLTNPAREELVFLSVYSEDTTTPRLPGEVLVTAAPPTPNGPLHLGHISGPYLASDIVTRYLRLRSSRVLSHCGTDDHQNYVTEAAQRAGDLTGFRSSMRSRIKAGLERMSIAYDEFIEPRNDAAYQARVRDFVERARTLGVAKVERLSLPHCSFCNLDLVDALIEGECPECGDTSRGGCESCGLVFAPFDLDHPRCGRCQNPASFRPHEVLTFDFSRHLAPVLSELETRSLSPSLKRMVTRAAQLKDHKVLLSHPATDTNHVRIEVGGSLQAIHVWFEMAAHYERFAHDERYWIHCFGFDNGFHYLLFIPALLKAMSASAKLPDAVISNEFLELEGAKFSTSRRHAIWADEFSADPDIIRLYLCLERPAARSANFTREDFEHFRRSWEKTLDSLVALASEPPTTSARHPSAIIACNRFTREIETDLAPANFDLREAVRRLLAFADQTLESHERGARLRIMALVNVLQIFAPATAQRLERALELKTPEWVRDWGQTL